MSLKIEELIASAVVVFVISKICLMGKLEDDYSSLVILNWLPLKPATGHDLQRLHEMNVVSGVFDVEIN